MILEITDYFGNPVKLQPRVELYSVSANTVHLSHQNGMEGFVVYDL